MKSIPEDKLRELARYLDECPNELSGNQDEYWRLLIKRLPRRLYTRDQIERFADQYQSPSGSPSLLLLYDLREKGVKLEQFKQCLEKIRCDKALNLFLHGTIPEFTRQPRSTTIPIRGRLVLTCSAQCDPPPPEYLWYKNSFPLVSERSEVLEIECVNPSHAGLYQCVALNPRINNTKANYVVSHPAKVEVLHYSVQESDHISQETEESSSSSSSSSSSGSSERLRSHSGLLTPRSGLPEQDIVINEQPKDLQCRFREMFSLTCKATSKTGRPLSFTWFRKKRGRSEKMKMGSGQTLTSCWNRCEKLQICCVVSVEDGSSEEKVESDMVTVSVITIWFTEQPRPVNGFIGHQALIRCVAGGKEPITYLWFKSMTSGGRKEVVSDRQSSDCGILHFESLQPTDWGYYTCQAENEDDFISSKSVYVRCEPEISDGPEITITRQPGSIVCQPGNSVTFVCEATCSVRFSYCWYHNDTIMDPVEDQSSIGIYVDENTFGSYCCHITTNDGYHRKEKRSRVAQLVLGEPVEKPGNMNRQQIDQWSAELELVTVTGTLFAHDKLALLIGNQNYGQGVSRLSSSVSDVNLLKTELESLDFKVFAFSDLSFVEMMRVFVDFCDLIRTWGMYVVFYYSGHGFDYQKVEYLMPVDAKIPLECDKCISADFVTCELQKTLSKVFVFLDCCRTSYDSADKVKGPHKTSIESCAYANIFKALSCSRNQPAYEKRKEPCSVFNRVLRNFLNAQRSTSELDSFLLQGMQQEGQSKGGRAFQRPDTHVKMLPVKLSLHDPIMWETWNTTEGDLRVRAQDAYDQSTIVPAPVNLAAVDFDGLIEGKVCFERELANVITLKAEFTKHHCCEKAFFQVNLNNQGAGVEGGEACDSLDKKAVKQELRIVGLQKTRVPELEIRFTVSAISTSGQRKECQYACKTRVAIIGTGQPVAL